MKCVYLIKAEYQKDYQVYIEFNDGKAGTVDLKDTIYHYKQAEIKL